MQIIRDLLTRDLSERIEEVIKLDQQDEATVYNEILEYVATDRIKRQYLEVLRAIADAPGEPSEGIGVWISGFFGSGKSSFAKILGYILADRELKGKPASNLFVQQLWQQVQQTESKDDDRLVQDIEQQLNFINARLDTSVIMFDVQLDRAVRRATEPIAEIMYTVLLRELDYAQDYDVAELEIELEREGRLAEFVRQCAELYSDLYSHLEPADVVPVTLSSVSADDYAIWQRVRKGAQRIHRTSAVLHRLDPSTYTSQDSWASSLQETGISIRVLVDRTFELSQRRRPGHAVVFIIDEVGQYVARSADKIENLRAVVEHFGQEGKNRVLRGKAEAPVWVMVTSQEKLEEVVAAIDDKRVELAKLQDRFPIRIDMAPADIREVATRRVLSKTEEGENLLAQRYDSAAALLKTHTRLERTSRHIDIDKVSFIQFYPYMPYFIDLSIDIVSGIRLQAGAPRHIGGSNRTIIKQTYEMLVSDQTGLAEAPIGTLVTLDKIFDLVHGNLSSEKQKDITDILQRWPDDPWPARVAKAIALLEHVRDLPRTEQNLAALLYGNLGGDSPLDDVQRAISLLDEHQFIRETEHGWKLQTAQEKSWMAERNAHSPSERARKDLIEDRLRVIFESPGLTRFRYHQRTFRVGVSWHGRSLTSGNTQVPLELRVADGPDVFGSVCDQVREDSRTKSQENNIFWVMSLNNEIDDLVAELSRSQQMVGKYEQLRAQNKINKDEAASLASEKTQALRLQERLRDRLEAALAGGRGFFRGVARDAAELGKSLNEIMKGLFEWTVPDLYPKLEMGAKPLKGNEAEEILKAANLNGLPKIFYGPPDGLNLVVKEGTKYVVNLKAPILQEVSNFLKGEHEYGNKVTGRTLENHFGGLGYGWEREMLWLMLATLLRGGAIEVTYQGRRYRNHLDPQVRVPFSGTNAFRAASFAPRKAPDLQTLVQAVQRYEALTGDEVDVEESAIAQAFQTLARAELEALVPVEARVKAHDIPVLDVLTEYRAMLETVLNSASDDVVNMLAGEGASFEGLRNRVAVIRNATDDQGLARLQRIRAAVNHIWPMLRADGLSAEEVEELEDRVSILVQHLDDSTFYQRLPEIEGSLHRIEGTYHSIYEERHRKRTELFQGAIDDVNAQPESSQVSKDLRKDLLKPLKKRTCHDLVLGDGGLVCHKCGAGLGELASDLAAVDQLKANVLLRLKQLAVPDERVVRVKVTEVIGAGKSVTTHNEIDETLERLRGHLYKVVDSGAKVVLE